MHVFHLCFRELDGGSKERAGAVGGLGVIEEGAKELREIRERFLYEYCTGSTVLYM